MEIRNFSLADANQVWEIEKQVIDVPWSLVNIKDMASNDNIFARVLEDNGEIIGYYSFYNMTNEADINNIAIAKKWQGFGYGKLLMQDLIDNAYQLNLQEITLEVSNANVVAYNMYSKFGFVVEGVRKKYYNNTDDALIMWKR